MNKILVIHHNDMDGRCAAAIASRALSAYNTKVEFVEMDYNKPFPLIKNDVNEVFILDFSFKKNDMDKLISLVGKDNITWIDHHVSSIADLRDYDYLKGIRSIDYCGAKLTWMYFNEEKDMDCIPVVVDYVDDYDRWQMKYTNDTLNLFEYLNGLPLGNITGYVWSDLLGREGYEVTPLIKMGSELRERRYDELRIIINELGKKSTIVWNGVEYSCININSSYLKSTSQMGDIIIGEYGMDIAHMYHEKVDSNNFLVRVHQLRTKKGIDIAADIAMKQGGGGHKNASGWTDIIVNYDHMDKLEL